MESTQRNSAQMTRDGLPLLEQRNVATKCLCMHVSVAVTRLFGSRSTKTSTNTATRGRETTASDLDAPLSSRGRGTVKRCVLVPMMREGATSEGGGMRMGQLCINGPPEILERTAANTAEDNEEMRRKMGLL